MRSWDILHVNTEGEWRGGEAQTLLLARGLRARGHGCHLAVQRGSPLESRARQAGLRVIPFTSHGEFDPLAALCLAGHLRAVRPHLVHYHTSHAITLGTLASLRAGRRPSLATRRVSFPLSRNPLARLKYTYRVDRIIAVSEGIRDALLAEGIPAERTVVIPSAVDLDRFRTLADRTDSRRSLGVEPGEFLVGSVGHLAAHKGYRVLVEAARLARRTDPLLRFLLVGRGEREKEIRRQVDAAGLGSAFRLLGFREEVATILPALDLLVFPSLSGEGSPAVLKEAMACGVPIVASDIPGVREVVRSGIEGLLVPPGDPVVLAEAILRVAREGDLGLEFTRRGRERCLAFGVERLVEQTESLYGEVLENRRP